jgi:hypothetical protein
MAASSQVSGGRAAMLNYSMFGTHNQYDDENATVSVDL